MIQIFNEVLDYRHWYLSLLQPRHMLFPLEGMRITTRLVVDQLWVMGTTTGTPTAMEIRDAGLLELVPVEGAGSLFRQEGTAIRNNIIIEAM